MTQEQNNQDAEVVEEIDAENESLEDATGEQATDADVDGESSEEDRKSVV